MHNAVSRWTLIIPTFCRPEFLKRSLSYYQSAVCPRLKIIIVDSSPEPIAQKNSEIIENFKSPRLSVSQVRTDPSTKLFQKIKIGLDVCETDYVGLAADDDILLISKASRYIDILEKNADVFSASGMVAKLNLENAGSSERWIMKVFPKNLSNDPVSRLRLQCNWLTTYLWSYYRTHQLKDLLNFLEKTAPSQWDQFSEYFLYFLMVLTGKIARESDLAYLMVRHSLTETARREDTNPEDDGPIDGSRNREENKVSNKMFCDALRRFYRESFGVFLPEDMVEELQRFFALNAETGGFRRLGPVPEIPSEGSITQVTRRLIYLGARSKLLRVSGIPVRPNACCWLAFKDRAILKNAVQYIYSDE